MAYTHTPIITKITTEQPTAATIVPVGVFAVVPVDVLAFADVMTD